MDNWENNKNNDNWRDRPTATYDYSDLDLKQNSQNDHAGSGFYGGSKDYPFIMSDPADTTPIQEEPAQAPSQEGPNVYYYDDATKESVSSVEYDSRSGGYGGGFVIPPAGSTAYGSERNYSDNDSKYSNNRSSSYGSRNNDFYGYDIPTAGSGGDNSRKGNTVVLNMSRRFFVLILIFCMIATSAITLGLVNHFNKPAKNGSATATDYKLASSKKQLSYKGIIAKAEDSVVSITTESVSTDSWAGNYVTQGAGSGVIIKSNGYILTCNHVIEDASKITVTLNNKKTYSATVIGSDSDKDLAVVKINAEDLTAATYGDSSKLSVGDDVVAIGNPLGELGGTATTGIISALNRNLTIEGKKMSLLQTDASINPGNSGGALFNSSGNLIGIVVAKSSSSGVEGLGFAIPINQASKTAATLIKTKHIDKSSSSSMYGSDDMDDNFGSHGPDSDSPAENSKSPKIGVTVTEVDESTAQASGLTDGAGIYIMSVTSSSAREAGLETGDKITALDGTEVSTYNSLTSQLKKHKSGDRVTLTIKRSGTTKKIKVTLS